MALLANCHNALATAVKSVCWESLLSAWTTHPPRSCMIACLRGRSCLCNHQARGGQKAKKAAADARDDLRSSDTRVRKGLMLTRRSFAAQGRPMCTNCYSRIVQTCLAVVACSLKPDFSELTAEADTIYPRPTSLA